MESEYRYRTLYEIATELTSTLAPDDVLETIVREVAHAVDVKACSLMLLSQDGEQLIHTISHGLSEWYLHKGPVRFDQVIAEVLDGHPVAIEDASTDPRVQYREQAAREGIASILSVPLKPDGHVIGIMRVYTVEPRRFSPEEIEFLGSVANLGAIALDKARAHEALGEDVAQLEEDKARFLGFLGEAAHDLKAPLTAIQGYLWVLLDGFAGELAERQRKMLLRSSHRIDELLNLISDLLDIPRIESGQIHEEIKVVDLGEVIETSCDHLQALADQKGVKLGAEIPSELSKVHASVPRMQQVITNLVSNGINYTQDGAVTIAVHEEEDGIRIEVSDTGIGIPPEELSSVFTDFFRASNVETRGTGLGLSITKRIVEAHGGRIWVESPCPGTDVGSRFTFTLPSHPGGTRAEQGAQ